MAGIIGGTASFKKTIKVADYETEAAEVVLNFEGDQAADGLYQAAVHVFGVLGVTPPKHLSGRPAGKSPDLAAPVVIEKTVSDGPAPEETKPSSRRGRPAGSTNKPKEEAKDEVAGPKPLSPGEVGEAAAAALAGGVDREKITAWRSEFKVDSVRDIVEGERQEFVDGLKLLEDGKTPTRTKSGVVKHHEEL